jgi:addiction module HigA family antidote
MRFRERRPIHPGEILAEDILPELGMNANQVGEALGVPANRISEILRGRRSITADTALRLGRWLGSSPQFWMNLQRSYDLEVAEKELGAMIEQQVTPLEKPVAA